MLSSAIAPCSPCSTTDSWLSSETISVFTSILTTNPNAISDEAIDREVNRLKGTPKN
jgi:hypothetical protein